jgi:hypothetical protein
MAKSIVERTRGVKKIEIIHASQIAEQRTETSPKRVTYKRGCPIEIASPG